MFFSNSVEWWQWELNAELRKMKPVCAFSVRRLFYSSASQTDTDIQKKEKNENRSPQNNKILKRRK